MRLIESLYAYPWNGKDNNCNSFVFAGVLNGGKHVVVDPGHIVTPYYREPGLERLLQAMERDGLSASSIGMTILTHGHPDHAESATIIRNEYHALVAMHEADEPAFSAMGGKVDIFLDQGSLELGTPKPTKLQILHSPGHTPGHITIFEEEQSVLIAGDCIFYRSTGRADLPGGNVLALRETVERLSRLNIEYLLCGHPYGHSGILSGRETVRDNFRYIKNFI